MAKKYLDPKADVTFKKVSPQDLIDNPQVNEALEIVKESAYSEAERYAYEKFWDAVSCEKTLLGDVERKLDAAVAKLNAANVERDAANAERDAANVERDAANAERDAAIAKMRQDKLDTARNLKTMSLSIEQIATATGLSAEEIEKL